METEQLIGKENTVFRTVTADMTASAVGSGGVDVLSTPSMILWMEQAARDAVQNFLHDGYTTVGVRVAIRHLAATPVGEKVSISATVDKTNGKLLIFRVEAKDEHNRIGEGYHDRYIVNLKKFIGKLSER